MLGLALAAAPARAQCGPGRVGLVLSGGGARGFAHVGVLRVLEQAGVRADCVAGTSMGAVVGAFYAAGFSVDHIEDVVRGVDWQRIFSGRADRSLLPAGRRTRDLPPILVLGFEGRGLRLPESALPDHGVNRMLIGELAAASLAAGGDFARLPIPFRAVTLDIRSGERVVLALGDLARAVRASMSIPLAFAPVASGERLLVDGGLVDNVPVGVARAMGAERVIAVDVTSPPREAAAGADALQVALRITDLLAQAQNAAYRERADVTLRPELGSLTFTDFASADELIRAGCLEACAHLDELAPGRARPALCTATGPTGCDAPHAVRRGAPGQPEAAALDGRALLAVEWNGLDGVHPDVASRLVPLRGRDPLDLRRALRGLDALHASDLFRSYWLSFEPLDEDAGHDARALKAVFDVHEAQPWALELGGGYDEDDGAFGLLRARRRSLFGGAGRFQVELRAGNGEETAAARLVVDRLGRLPLGLSAEMSGRNDKPLVYDPAGDVLERARFEQRRLRVALRRGVARAWLAQVGLETGEVETRARPGAGLAARLEHVRRLHAQLAWDTADDAYAPERGGDVRAAFERHLPGLGAPRTGWRAALRGRYVFARAAVQVDLWAALSGGEPAPYDLFRLGGPELVPGRARDEQWGAQALAVAWRARRPLKGRLMGVARLGAGGTWRARRDVRLDGLTPGVGLGLEHPTPLGPVALEYARHAAGRGGFYFSIGRRLPAASHPGERP